MPSPSEAAKRAAGTYLARGRVATTISLDERDRIAALLDSFAAAQVEAAVAAARAEMRERCAAIADDRNKRCWQSHDRGRVPKQDMGTAAVVCKMIAEHIRAIPLDPEVTK